MAEMNISDRYKSTKKSGWRGRLPDVIFWGNPLAFGHPL